MVTKKNRRALAVTLLVVIPSLAGSVSGQVLGIGREHATLTRLRPSDVQLANQTILVQVSAVDPHASGITERLKKLITNRVVGVNKNLREVSKNPYYLVDCTITRYEYNQRTETKKLLGLKDQGTFKIITASLEASYNVTRSVGNITLFGGNIPAVYKKEFREGLETAPVQTEVEDALIRLVVGSVLLKLTNTEEKIEVRLMGQGGLSRFGRLAEAGQWMEYIQSVEALPEHKVEKGAKSSFEADRSYDLSIAYEARFYEVMWKDYKRAQQFFDLADSKLRKARENDPKETEYIKGQARLNQGKQYFETIKERFPGDIEAEKPLTQADPRDINKPNGSGPDPAPQPPAASSAMTNKGVIEMVSKGVPERLIIDQINEAAVKQFDISYRGIIQLTTAGVSEKIIDVIKSAMRRHVAPPPPRRKRP